MCGCPAFDGIPPQANAEDFPGKLAHLRPAGFIIVVNKANRRGIGLVRER
jgi:hypothetical protein